MIHPHVLAALARARSAAFLTEAEAARRARQPRPGRSLPPATGGRGSLPHWLMGHGRARMTALVTGLATTACPAGGAPRAAVIAPGGRGHDRSPRSWGGQC